ncbi:MAG: filamentous hemagglutinin N-terminal domain-containing protein [Alphaproteobacteria bacterium]|nr:filamentous hemagglutinin N-terminal domain-containing protein [Alphaproteobacteria bacterium]MBU2307383.1 filamentous hemagglutinin N-terminal domain-containing protein [Alphaproteobacteria bacterium]
MSNTASPADRSRLLARTALCGALCGLALLPGVAQALPIGQGAQVSAGGTAPTITTGTDRIDVNLGAARTVMDWSNFDVTPGETVSFNFGARNWIVLNRINNSSPTKIEGTIEGKVGGQYGGNIWFTSRNSIIFGKGAKVDAGGILVGLGTPDLSSFLDPASTLFSFSGSDNLPALKIMVLANAKMTAHGGTVALLGPSVITRANALVSATEGSALYGSAKTYQIRMAPGTAGDFDLVDFIVSDASGGSDAGIAIDLGGDTRANSVFLAAVNSSGIGSAIINLEGLVTAQAAKADGGDIILSGGGGIANRLAGPAISGVSATDIYLNKATATRDLRVSNVGRTFGRPWARPLDELLDPPTLEQDEICRQRSCGGNGNGNGNGFAPLETIDLDRAVIASLFDPTAISVVSAGRDAKIAATARIELGRVIAARDIAVEGGEVRANALVANGALNVNSTVGEVVLAGVGVMGQGTINAKTDVRLESIAAPQKLTVTSGRDITVGDDGGDVSGVISVSAPQTVTLNLGSGRIDSVTAGAAVNLRGAVDVGTIVAPKVFGEAASVKIGTVTTTGDLYVIATNGDASVGNATAGDDIYVLATHGTASLTTATLTGAAPDAVTNSFAGIPDTAGNGRVVVVRSTDLDAKLGLGTGGVTGATAVSVIAGRDAAVEVIKETPGSFSVTAARDATLRAPTVTLTSVQAGRDLSVGSTTGDFTLTNSLTAVRNISVSAAGALRVADVRADSGSVSLVGATVTAGNVSASEDLTLRALSGGVTTTSFRTGRDLIVQGSSLSLGGTISSVPRDLSITSLGNFTSSTPLSAGRNLILDVAGKATLGATTAVNSIRIVAGDLDLTGALTAPNAQIESKAGAMQVGGAGGGSGFVLDATDFGQLRVSGVTRIYAGSTTGAARGDLTLQDLAINTANTPSVAFLVGSGNNALVQGMVAPTASGGTIRIGDATDLSWRPASILVTGALGAATFAGATNYTGIRAFSEVRLAARQDILFGSPRFIALIQGTPVSAIDIAAGLPVGSSPIGNEVGKVFVSTGRLEVSSEGKAVQQNTAPVGSGGTAGLYFTGAFNPALIIDPPRIVELWGAIAGSNGQVITGSAAGSGLTFTVVDTNGQPISRPDGAAYRFNACDVGTTNCPVISAPSSGGSGSADMNAGVLTARDLLDDAEALDALGSESLTSPPVLLGVAEVPTDEIVTDPVVTGTGSEEIWRKRRQTK